MMMIAQAVAPASSGTRSRASGSSSSAPNDRLYPGTDFIPNMGDNYNFLPGMSKWDGIPYYEFKRHWWAALLISLGAVVQGGYTGHVTNERAKSRREQYPQYI